MITIKKASSKDLMKIFQFLKMVGKDLPSPYFRIDRKIDNIKVFVRLMKHLFLNPLQKIANYSTIIWLAEDYDGVKGIAVIGISNKRVLLHDIYIIGNYRRKGIGSKLIKVVIDFSTRGDYVLGLFVEKDNISAINFYKKHGFKVISFNNASIYMEYKM